MKTKLLEKFNLTPSVWYGMAHKTPEFEKIIRKAMTEWKVPGLVIGVIQRDEI